MRRIVLQSHFIAIEVDELIWRLEWSRFRTAEPVPASAKNALVPETDDFLGFLDDRRSNRVGLLRALFQDAVDLGLIRDQPAEFLRDRCEIFHGHIRQRRLEGAEA